MSAIKPRDTILAIAVALGFILFQYSVENVDLLQGAGAVLAILGLVVAFGAVATLIYDRMVKQPIEVGATEVPQPALSRLLFHDTRSAPIWLIVRFYLGFQWLEAGIRKVSDVKWSYGNGTGLLGYWKGAVAIPAQGTPKISYEWYREFLNYLIGQNAHTWFAPLVAWGEVLVGIGLIVGGLVGIAAFFGALMNMSFMLAGTASTNPVLFILAVLVILGWQVAGYYGADRFILPLIGAPWRPGKLFHRGAPVPVPAA